MTQSIQAALVAAGLVNGDQIDSTQTSVKRVSRKPVGRKHGRSSTRQVLDWEHDTFGSLTVAINLDMATSKQEGPNTWAEVRLPSNNPEAIVFELTDSLEEGVHLLICNGEEDVTNLQEEDLYPTFRVPIQYRDDGTPFIETKAGSGADRDFVFIASNGMFVNYEVSAAVRGRAWVQGQESYGGQFVVLDLGVAQATPGLEYHEVDGKAITAVPLYDENAYPSPHNPETYCNFLKIVPGAKKVAEYAYRIGAYVSIEDCQPAKWDPQWPELTERQKKNGWKGAVVTFFNLTLGYGFAECQDDHKQCFLHFKNLIDENGVPVYTQGEFPQVQPMSGILLRYKKEDEEVDGRRKARSFRPA